MAKLPAKKPKLTPEEQLAELAALTGDVAAINLMHSTAPPAATVAAAAPVSTPSESVAPPAATADAVIAQDAPASAEPTAEKVSIQLIPTNGVGEGAQEGKSTVVSAAVSTPEPMPQPTVEKQPVVAETPVTKTPALVAEPTATADDTALTEEAVALTEVPAHTAGTDYSFAALFEPSKDKKTVMMRITPALHLYFQQFGLLLGDGASVPDVVHNILMEWKSLHEKQVQKALQKQMRLMLKNAS